MLLEELINTYEELKKYIFIVDRGDKSALVIKFKNENFFHLVGLHKTNFNMFIPNYIKSKDKKYKYVKKNITKFNNILLSELKEEELLNYRVLSFKNIIDLLQGNNTTLYNLMQHKIGSLYDGDFGLLKIYKDYNCLLGLVIDEASFNGIKCVPQSWMASKRINYLIDGKKPIYMKNIMSIPISIYDQANNDIFVNT